MQDDNSRNLLYFESQSMRDLYQLIQDWQENSKKRLLSANIQRDGDMFCCIALTNPTEVIICDGGGSGNRALVFGSGSLSVTD